MMNYELYVHSNLTKFYTLHCYGTVNLFIFLSLLSSIEALKCFEFSLFIMVFNPKSMKVICVGANAWLQYNYLL